MVDGSRLLMLFGVLMVVVGLAMLRPRKSGGNPNVMLTRESMPLINAIGSSLVSVTAFGATTAASYAWSGLVDWPLAMLFIAGGTFGGFVGIKLAHHLARYKHALTLTFSGVVIAVGLYVIAKSLFT